MPSEIDVNPGQCPDKTIRMPCSRMPSSAPRPSPALIPDLHNPTPSLMSSPVQPHSQPNSMINPAGCPAEASTASYRALLNRMHSAPHAQPSQHSPRPCIAQASHCPVQLSSMNISAHDRARPIPAQKLAQPVPTTCPAETSPSQPHAHTSPIHNLSQPHTPSNQALCPAEPSPEQLHFQPHAQRSKTHATPSLMAILMPIPALPDSQPRQLQPSVQPRISQPSPLPSTEQSPDKACLLPRKTQPIQAP